MSDSNEAPLGENTFRMLGDLLAELDRWWGIHQSSVVEFRRFMHAHPERSGTEVMTTERVVGELRAAGLEPQVLTSRPGTGAIATWDSGKAGPTIAVRADIDALGSIDLLDEPYRSTVPGVAHACGHDAHTAIVLALARFLTDCGPGLGLAGRVRLLFEPAEEEVPGGAIEMIAEGALDHVDAIVGLHCDPKSDVGRVGLRAGAISSAADQLTIDLIGPGGHTARPEETVDLVSVAANVILSLPESLRAAQSGLSAVFGAVIGGDAPNAIPTLVRLRGSVRTPDATAWERAEHQVQAALYGALADSGALAELTYVQGVPPVINDPTIVGLVRSALSAPPDSELEVFGAPRSAGADTFAWYSQRVPACYMRLGTHNPAWPEHRDLHHGRFDIDERALRCGFETFARSVVALLSELR
ncbi:MAG: amidohydrolase [Acidimicrobiia bacterium]|jgi:amidohydrolase|nr:amidohydrolase [Acidimicrobiia bacterium]MBP8179514.1 amidohydrolase [Acidimicrobiia bacterium]